MLLCIICEQFKHRLHRINELQIIMVDKEVAPARNLQTMKLLNKMVGDLTDKLDKTKKIYESA